MRKFIAFIERIYSFIRFDIWRITEYELTQTRRLFYRVIKTIVLAIRGFVVDNLNVRASALTYSILFAMIPLFALIIAIAKGFGVDKLIENSLQDTFIGQANMIPTVMGFVQRYLDSTQGGLFIGIGIAILFGSVMNFFIQVENAFNSIWQVKKSRSILRQFTTYFSAILIIPLLIVLSSGLSIYVATILSHTYFFNLLSPLLRFGVSVLPYIINWIVFTILYIAIPNTRVRFKNALMAGIIAGTAFQIFQILYINGQVYLSRFNVVYGSFAAIPLLLLWLQISCLIILLGAEISYASQNIKNYDFELDTKNISNRYKNFLILFITHLVVKQFENQKPPFSAEQISLEYNLPIRLVNEILNQLVEVAILIEVFNESSKAKTYQPAIDINQLTVNHLFSKLDSNGSELFLSSKNDLLDEFWNKTMEIKNQSVEQTKSLLVKDI